MLTLFVSLDQNFIKLFSDGDGLSFVADLSFLLANISLSIFVKLQAEHTSGNLGSLGSSVNIFFTQNLPYCQSAFPRKTKVSFIDLYLPKLSRFHSGRLLVNKNSPDIGSSAGMDQSFILLFW